MVLPATRLALHRSATHQWMALACKVVKPSQCERVARVLLSLPSATKRITTHNAEVFDQTFPLPQLWWLPKYILRFGGLVWLPSSVQVKFSYYKVKHVVKLLFKLAGTLFWDKYDERLTRLLASPVASEVVASEGTFRCHNLEHLFQ